MAVDANCRRYCRRRVSPAVYNNGPAGEEEDGNGCESGDGEEACVEDRCVREREREAISDIFRL